MRVAVCLIIALAACTSGPLSSTPDGAPSIEPAPVSACGGSVAQIESYQYGTIDGVDPNLLSLDVHSPATPSACPALIWVHGGSWQLGDKSSSATLVKAAHFVAEGYVFVSVNYRLVDESNDVRWPDFGNDAAAATAWVIDNAGDLGIDPDRVALIGHSSGAHIVSIVGTNPDLLVAAGRTRADVACVVSLDSVTHDLTDRPTFEREIIDAAFGDDVATLIDGSPTQQATEHANDGPIAEFLIVTRGRDVRLASAAKLEASLLAGGATASVYDASPYDHGDVNVQLGEPDESNITPVVTEFLADCLA